ncbi:flagellar filament capping protein FliD [Pollutimonas sp. H1-120]|uniref:flagellar filament capping protein FliD n=1 Tax=Pollutimonas sp. H1-120 TaxID=3148824 RepID=UPI003B5275C4
MAISSIGVGSGLPLDELLGKLRASENQALTLIESRATSVQSRLTAYGTIKSSIEALKTASDALGKAETFGALKTSVNSEAFTAAANSKAIAGQYSIEVTQLASSQTLTSSSGMADRKATLANGSVDIAFTIGGTTKTITVAQDQTSLEGIVKAINGDSSLGVSATIVNDGSGTPHRLLLTAKNTGEQAALQTITVTATDAGAGTDISQVSGLIGYDSAAPGPNFTEITAKNAIVQINGIQVQSQSNTIEDVIEGVTLTLTKQSEVGKPSVLSVTADDSVTSKAVNTFVTAYNNLQNIIKTLTSYNVDTQKGSALTGDSLARQVQSQIRSALNVAGSPGAIRNLSQMGITTNPSDGILKVDDTKLAAALKDNMVDVQKLFAGENGVSAKMAAAADAFVKSGGSIPSATDSMNNTLKDLEKQYEAMSNRIDAKMETYRQQFSQLDTMMAQMNSVSSYLTQQLSMLGNTGEQK